MPDTADRSRSSPSSPAFSLSRGGYAGLFISAVALIVVALFVFWLMSYTSNSADVGMAVAAVALLVIAGVLMRILLEIREKAARQMRYRLADPTDF